MEEIILHQLKLLVATVPCLSHFTFVVPANMPDTTIESLHSCVTHAFPHLKHIAIVPRPGGVEIDVTGDTPEVRMGVVLLAGRYLKHSRTISQSPWFLQDGTRKGSASLQELIAEPVLSLCFDAVSGKRRRCQTELKANSYHGNRGDDSDVYKFVAAGREDIDVRMLGDGRPFLLHVTGASRVPSQASLDAVMTTMDADPECPIGVVGLRVVQSDAMQKLLEGEEKKQKTYRCVVWFARVVKPSDPDVIAINSVKDLVIHQQTPMRVLHRRTLLTRDRIVHSVTLTIVNDHWGVLDLVTSAGTYVKEFVFGDHGRTTPSLGLLLHTTCDIMQLDVMNVDMEW